MVKNKNNDIKISKEIQTENGLEYFDRDID
jgi:hypothetical protein